MTGEHSSTRATKPSKFSVFVELCNNSPKCKNSLQENIQDWQKDNGDCRNFILSEPGFELCTGNVDKSARSHNGVTEMKLEP